MALLKVALLVSLALLLIDAVIEVAFASTTASFLKGWASRNIEFTYESDVVPISGRPYRLITEPGDVSNGSAGTAIILVCLVGFLALWLRGRSNFHSSLFSKIIYHAWLLFTILSAVFTLAALVYSFVEHDLCSDSTISPKRARIQADVVNSDTTPYGLDYWTPEIWFSHMLTDLNLVDAGVASTIKNNLNIIKAVRLNLIPQFLLGLIVMFLAIAEAVIIRRADRNAGHGGVREDKLASRSLSDTTHTGNYAGQYQQHSTYPSQHSRGAQV